MYIRFALCFRFSLALLLFACSCPCLFPLKLTFKHLMTRDPLTCVCVIVMNAFDVFFFLSCMPLYVLAPLSQVMHKGDNYVYLIINVCNSAAGVNFLFGPVVQMMTMTFHLASLAYVRLYLIRTWHARYYFVAKLFLLTLLFFSVFNFFIKSDFCLMNNYKKNQFI